MIKKINGINSCSQIVHLAISEIEDKLGEKKYNVGVNREDKIELTNNAYEILCYLESSKIVMLTDVLRLKNHYKISFDIYNKSEDALREEFLQFIDDTTVHAKNPQKLVVKQLSSFPGIIRQFFIHLNSSLNIGDTIAELTKIDQRHEKSGFRTLVYYLWLFGCYKAYLKRLYEVPIPNPIPNAPISSASQYDDTFLQSLEKRHVNSNLKVLPFEKCRTCILSMESNKDEIMQILDIRDSTYEDLLKEWNITSHVYLEF